MNKIRVLPDNLANQIAAGEVVERPASVVKELIENSLDAGARRIAVEIELGGRRLIRISDDGEGMIRDDAILAFERHATSKIRSLDDLGHIGTLGFRGEALASIASVAKVELLTKTESEDAATRVVVEGGRMTDVKDASRDKGTTISVRELFFNTPARRKFMRSEATENYHLTSIVTHYALAHPEIAILLTNNGREVLNATPARSLRERAFQIFGSTLIESLLPVDGGREYVAKVTGFVSAPRERRTTRDSQFFFVNNRFVRDKTIAGGLLEGYRSVLPHGVYPVAFLFIELPPDEVDVNVHPAKTEVRFRRGEAVKDVIADAVRTALGRAGIVGDRAIEAAAEPPRTGSFDGAANEIDTDTVNSSEGYTEKAFASDHAGGVRQNVDIPQQERQPDKQRFDFDVPKESSAVISETVDLFSDDLEAKAAALAFNAADDDGIGSIDVENDAIRDESKLSTSVELPPVNSAEKLIRSAEVSTVSSAKIKPVGQLHESFIIAVDDEGLLLIDQHVAHERILFDKFKRSETDRRIESQNLLLPETVDLNPAQSEAFGLIENDLESLGFGTMRLSGRTVAIKSIPTDLPATEARNLFAEILDTIEAEKKGAPKSSFRDDIAASLACKAAVKINMPLTHEKMQWLIDRLLLTTSPTTCPHGRPVILRLSMKDIERGFHRT